jgi:hypothetical protein
MELKEVSQSLEKGLSNNDSNIHTYYHAEEWINNKIIHFLLFTDNT